VEGHHQPDLTGKTDSELLVTIGRKASEPAVIREAWAELYRRHADYIFRVCRRVASNLGHLQDQVAEETVCEVFRHVYEHAADRFVPKDVANADEERKHVRAWLGKVAQRVMQTVKRNRKSCTESNVEAGFLKEVSETGIQTHHTPNTNTVVRQVLESVLDETEREIVIVRMQWYAPDRPGTRNPPDVLNELSTRLNKTKESIRKTYERALKKVEEALIRAGLAATR
jgi:DNA-directed RNA polymerase specialized sigma24 family protein